MEKNSEREDDLFLEQLEKAYKDFVKLSYEFLHGNHDRVSIIHHALRRTDGVSSNAAWYIIKYLPVDDIKRLLPDLLYYIQFYNSWSDTATEAVLMLPKDWLMDHMESEAGRFLHEEAEPYDHFLYLFLRIDRNFALRLAKHAISHSNPEVVEIAYDFIRKNNLG